MEEGNYKQLWSLAKMYLTQKLDYSRLTVAEKMSVLLSKVTLVFVAILVASGLLFHLTCALVVVLADALNSEMWAHVIVSLLFVVIMLIVYAFRVKLIVDPITRCITKLFVKPEDNDKSETL